VHRSRSLITGTSVLLLAAIAPPGHAEVAASGPSGFSLKIELPIAAPPDEAFRSFIQLGRWWNPAHTYSGNASNLTLTPRPGGCFCERLPGGGFVKHMDVIYSAPGKELRLAGGLGPLQNMGAAGVMSLRFKPEAGSKSIQLTMTYTVSGFAAGPGYAPLAAPVDAVLMEQLTRFKRFAETGKATP
jgi:uncharacterized protein YndB with AHSA1/START domain